MRGMIMKRPVFYTLLAAVAAASFAAPAGAKGPKITVADADFDFGRVPNNQAVEHVFKVKNTGDRPLVITAVRTSCGCTAAMMESSVIEPGGTGNLRVSFNPRGGKGPVMRTVNISSNDPDNPALQIKVSASPVAAGEVDKPQPPPKRTHELRPLLSFGGKCAKCHAPAGKAVKGRFLFEAVCAKCHGARGEGVVIGEDRLGTRIGLGAMAVRTKEGLRRIITEGSGHPWMPGFGSEFGGPLSLEQVDSLVAFIMKDLKTEAREQPAKSGRPQRPQRSR